MTTPFSSNLETENPALGFDSTAYSALEQQAPELQVGQIPEEMRGPDTANLPDVVILAAETNVPDLIDPNNGVYPVPEYTGWPYNMGYVPARV